ncbi:MAG: two-component regulator propeller domain-containing protein, partial [Saprospiraceae bacterium]
MRIAILVFFLFLFSIGNAQLNGKYTFRHIDQTDGLLHTMVRGIGQDTRGFIWILTLNGLQRYDGSRFVNYPELTYNSSFGIVHDSELYVDTVRNEVWVTKGTQMQKLDLARNVMTSLQLKDTLKADSLHQAILFTAHNQDKALIGEIGVIHYEKNTSKVIGSFNINPGQHNRNTYVIKDPSSGDFWTYNFMGFFIADHTTKKIQSSADPGVEHPLLSQLWNHFGNNNTIRFILLDSYHNLWISTWTEYLLRYNLDDKILRTYSLKDVKKKQKGNEKGDLTLLIQAMYEDRQKNLWFGTDYAGLLVYNREKDDFDYITSDEKISNGLRYSYSVYTIFQDRDDNIWLGTDRGISIFNPYKNYFQSIRHVDGNDASVPKHDINDVIETPQGEILIATWGGGISVYDRQWNFIRNVNFPGPPDYNLVWSFVQNDDGMIWAGTQHGYI